MTSRRKWSKGSHGIQEGTIVIIREDHVPSMQWSLGRVIKVHPGSNTIIRMATIQTTTSIWIEASNGWSHYRSNLIQRNPDNHQSKGIWVEDPNNSTFTEFLIGTISTGVDVTSRCPLHKPESILRSIRPPAVQI